MKSRKRNHIIIFMLAAVFVLSLSGCGSSDDRAGQAEGSNEESKGTGDTSTADILQSEGESVEEGNGTQEAAESDAEPGSSRKAPDSGRYDSGKYRRRPVLYSDGCDISGRWRGID